MESPSRGLAECRDMTAYSDRGPDPCPSASAPLMLRIPLHPRRLNLRLRLRSATQSRPAPLSRARGPKPGQDSGCDKDNLRDGAACLSTVRRCFPMLVGVRWWLLVDSISPATRCLWHFVYSLFPSSPSAVTATFLLCCLRSPIVESCCPRAEALVRPICLGCYNCPGSPSWCIHPCPFLASAQRA
ncbi:hypothetical protein BDW62DRAFT_75835 [Aspergillus aurantiobrunneus]